MKYRPFGKLDFEVSEIGFGAASISGEGGGYGFGAITEEDAADLVHRSIDRGINLFDTAPIYGFCESEKRLGKALKGRRDGLFVVTKSGIVWDDRKRIRIDNSPAATIETLEQSLRYLQTELIELYLVHWPDPKVDIRKPVEVLAKAQEQGKIGAIGLSNSNPEDFKKASEIARIEVFQSELNLFVDDPIDSLFPLIREHNVGFMSWGTLDKGILTGRVTEKRQFDPYDVRRTAPWWRKADHTPRYRAMKKIMPILKEGGHTGLELALGYNLGFAECSTALCGVRSTEQLETAINALDNLPEPSVVEHAIEIAQTEMSNSAG